MTNTIPTEASEQMALFEWAEWEAAKYPQLRFMLAIPNGGSRHILEAMNLKKQGVKRGVPDIFLPVSKGGYHGMFIEMKRIKGGKASNDQIDYIMFLRSEGYKAVICNGWLDAKDEIEEYLEGEEQ